ncbi:MAG: ParM/StbA family protein [Anaerolinea sp.]|nr:ParM/StbA family protein [Anaerolinea sp.]
MLFGLDLGYGNTKLYGRAGGIVLPSHVAAAQTRAVAAVLGTEHQARPLHITVSSQNYYVGDNAHSWGEALETLDYDRFAGSAEAYALLYGAFARYLAVDPIPETEPIILYVGLPLEPLSGTETAVQETLAAVRKWLTGVHVWHADGQMHRVHVARVEITSQPNAIFFDFVLGEDGRANPQHAHLVSQETGLVSIGYNTIERQVIARGVVTQKYTAGTQYGVHWFLERINNALGGHYTLGELDTLLRANALDEAATRAALADWSRKVIEQIEKQWHGEWPRFGRILITGGGAALLNGRLLPRFQGKAIVPDDPILCIARGLYKLALKREM